MKTILMAATLAFTLLAAPAYADSTVNARQQVRIAHADLNLTGEVGAQVMMSRLKAGARRVCGGDPGRTSIAQRHAYRECVSAALDRAVTRLHAPLVTAAYDNRADRPMTFASR